MIQEISNFIYKCLLNRIPCKDSSQGIITFIYTHQRNLAVNMQMYWNLYITIDKDLFEAKLILLMNINEIII